jgi:hypothetical protein
MLLEFRGPVAGTAKNWNCNWTATGSNWICSCSCRDLGTLQLQLPSLGSLFQPAATGCNRLQPLLSQHVIREDFGDENKSKITQNGQEMAKL